MSSPFLGEIRMFAGTFAPRSWAFCNGTLLAISQYSALFSLLGTYYGGDGVSTFALPEMRGRLPMHKGHGPGLSPNQLGQRLGLQSVALNVGEMPAHTHSLSASSDVAAASSPAAAVLASQNDGDLVYTAEVAASVENLNSQTIATSGDGTAHNNMMPYLSISFIICLQGIYPSRN